MRRKIFMILFLLIGFPTFADTQQIDIAPGANVLCNANILGTTSGTVRLRANFVPEDIDLKWYDGNTMVNTTSASNTCTYDTAINLPTNPTKTGYTFKGWKVVTCVSELDTNIQGTEYVFKQIDGSVSAGVTRYGITENGTWAVQFSYGVVKGEVLCSASTDHHNTYHVNHPSGGNGGICSCRVTSYTPSGGQQCNYTQAPWAYLGSYPEEKCRSWCATGCGYYVMINGGVFRNALYGHE